MTSLSVSPYLWGFFLPPHFLLIQLPELYVFTRAEQRGWSPLSSCACPSQQPPCCVVLRPFWCIPLVSHGPWDAPALLPGWSLVEVLCTALLKAINLPAPEHRAQTCAFKSTEATCVSKEVLKDLVYQLSGREPIILFYFIFKLSVYFLIVPEVCSNPEV